jgi:hypothetical protein
MLKNPQRPLNTSYPTNPMGALKVGSLPAAPPRPAPGSDGNIARAGAPKHIVDAQPVPGQKRQSGDGVYTGPGQTYSLDDEKELPIKSHAKSIPVHPGMTDKQRAKIHPVVNDPNAILNDAANLGRKA